MSLYPLLAGMALICVGIQSAHAQLGQFQGELILRVLSGSDEKQVVEPFGYIDSKGIAWPVPAGIKIDGASIPRGLWSVIGHPYTGKYLEASVIHDHYCLTKSRHWKAVHKVFLDGLLARKVDGFQAKLMYIAVYRFGPRWDFDVNACFCKGCPPCAKPSLKRINKYQPKYSTADFDELNKRLMSGQYALEELEDVADYQLNTEILKR